MSEVNRWDIELFLCDVAPHVQLGPIADWKDPNVFAGMRARIIKMPKLRPLILWIPLAEFVAKRKDPLFGACFLFVAPRPAHARIETELRNRFEQGHRLVHIAALVRGAQHHTPLVDRILYRAHDQLFAQFGGAPIAKFNEFREIMLGVDMQQRKWKA